MEENGEEYCRKKKMKQLRHSIDKKRNRKKEKDHKSGASTMTKIPTTIVDSKQSELQQFLRKGKVNEDRTHLENLEKVKKRRKGMV